MWVSRWLKLHHVFLVYLWLTFPFTLEQQGGCFREGQWSERSLMANAPLDCFEAPYDTLLSVTALTLAARFVMQILHYIAPQLDYTQGRHCEMTILIWEGRKKKLFWRAMALTGEVTRNDSLQKSLRMFEVLPSRVERGCFLPFLLFWVSRRSYLRNSRAWRVSRISQSLQVANHLRCRKWKILSIFN